MERNYILIYNNYSKIELIKLKGARRYMLTININSYPRLKKQFALHAIIKVRSLWNHRGCSVHCLH